MKKRISAGALAACLLFSSAVSLAGCGKKSKDLSGELAGASDAVSGDSAYGSAQETQPQQELTWAETLPAPETAAAPETAGGTAAPAAPAAQEDRSGNPVPVQRVGTALHPLTGMPGYDGEYYAGQKVIGVVVENHPSARPQWGMSTPDVVLEYEVEGGISRMLWLYANADELPAKIGPVRSMRHDIVELARGWDLVFIHCGGSSFARDRIASYNGALTDLDAMYHDECFSRDSSRNVSMEHTLILHGDRYRSAVQSLGLNTVLSDPGRTYFRFADVSSPFRPGSATCESVHFEYSGYYTYDFKYDAASMRYKMDINGSPRLDDQGIQNAYKNCVLLYTDMADMHTTAKHQDLLLENGGDGIFFTNGGYTEIRWAKGGDTDPLRLYAPDGTELVLNAGNSYIGFVRSTQRAKTVIA